MSPGMYMVYVVVVAIAGAVSGLIPLDGIPTCSVSQLQPLQAAINWRMGALLPHKLQAVTFAFIVAGIVSGTVALGVFISGELTASEVSMNLSQNTEVWMWFGAVCQVGMTIHTDTKLYNSSVLQILVLIGGVTLPPLISTSLYYMILLLGELIASVIYDSAGALGLQVRAATPVRILGIFLVICGSVLLHYSGSVLYLLGRYFPGVCACAVRAREAAMVAAAASAAKAAKTSGAISSSSASLPVSSDASGSAPHSPSGGAALELGSPPSLVLAHSSIAALSGYQSLGLASHDLGVKAPLSPPTTDDDTAPIVPLVPLGAVAVPAASVPAPTTPEPRIVNWLSRPIFSRPAAGGVIRQRSGDGSREEKSERTGLLSGAPT